MLSNYFDTLILSIVQGVSEFIPVSSSAHLIILSKLNEFNLSSLTIDVSLHLGSFLAIIFYFNKDLINLIKNRNLALLIIFGSVPLIVFGYIFYTTNLIIHLRNTEVIAWMTLVFGIILYFADKIKVEKKIDRDLNLKNILIIGIFQILALIPGVSRSGITITAGRILNFNRYESSKISFYLSIPALAGASVIGLKDTLDQNVQFNSIVIFSTICSFIFSYLTIKYFLIYVKKFSLNIFVYYRIFLALILFAIIYN
jgi:undecaprenyl-diphosphatase|tara:strand:+ start:570 stop:1337 length:768 start_codon:yes stop_codon:yes gene_type:complete